jgi:hypothetical protein
VPRYGRDDVRGAVRFVSAQAGPSDAIVQVALSGSLRWYYDDLGTRPVHPPASALADAGAAQEFANTIASGAPVVWYLECRPESLDPRGLLRAALANRAKRVETTSFVGIRVHRYDVSPSMGPAGGLGSDR